MKRVLFRYKDGIVSGLLEDNHLLEISPYTENEQRLSIGSIYIAKVKSVVKNIDAAFVDIGDNNICFLPLSDIIPSAQNPNFKPLFIQRNNPQKICPGDELVVQVIREQIKSKQACVTTRLTFSGRYCVLLMDGSGINISKKITDRTWRSQMKKSMQEYLSEEQGMILRTNAYEVNTNVILEELMQLTKDCNDLLNCYKFRTVYSKLYSPDALWLADIRDTRNEELSSIETDDPLLFAEMKSYIEEVFPQEINKLVFIDDGYSIIKRYSLEKQIEESLYERVWLKSGAYLVIQPTEALIVIDVNTGKSIDKKNMQEHIFKINMEAAKEVCRQMRLRNLSGIIIVDFINMKSEEDKQKLLYYLSEECKKDPVLTTLVGMSALDLVQITRRKVRKPLYETFLAIGKEEEN